MRKAQESRGRKAESGTVVDLGQEGMVPMETNMIMEEMMDAVQQAPPLTYNLGHSESPLWRNLQKSTKLA